MIEKPKDTLQLIVHESDIPSVDKGSLIPVVFAPQQQYSESSSRKVVVTWPQVGRVAVVALTAMLLFFVGTHKDQIFSPQGQLAAPIVTVVDPYTLQVTPLDYGPQLALSQGDFFNETRNAFVSEEVTFVELDIPRKTLNYFVEGEILYTFDIKKLPAAGSWWDVSSGLYQVSGVEEVFFSTSANANFPWTIRFEENFIIHGGAKYTDDSPVSDDFVAGGIRIGDVEAKKLFEIIKSGTAVLVHTEQAAPDTFVYEPSAPTVSAERYFVADIDSKTVLASTDIDDPASIASLTKLMTALVAAEELDLDGRVYVSSPSFVTSLVPRLKSRSSVSMYSLLQLLLVESSNEAAEVIARELGREEFIAAMNEKASQLGMSDTVFADPSGLSADNVSTVGDLYRLTQYIHENRSFIIGLTKDASLTTVYAGGDFSGLFNFNEIEDVAGFVGGKVGETSAAGQTSISLHELEVEGSIRTIVIIVLGSTDRAADVETLVSFVEKQFGS